MKKIIFLGILMSFSNLSLAQITDENGVSATGALNQVLTGKIGIGTSSPSAELDVNGQVLSENIEVKFDNGFSGTSFAVKEDGSNLKFGFATYVPTGYSSIIHTDRNDVARYTFSVYDDQHTMFRLMDKNGNVGAGFQIGTSIGHFLHFPLADSKIVIGSTAGYLSSEGHKFIVKDGSAKIEGNIITNSNIGIGTSSFIDGSDTYRLSVDGRVRAHAVKVYTTWADFVFESDYKLPSLDEVEQHIKTYGHLKDIPSAKEVEQNGIELGEMNKLLLQKIEELTLYTIELKKEVDLLKLKLNKDE